MSYLDPAFVLLLLGHFTIRAPFAQFSQGAEKGRDWRALRGGARSSAGAISGGASGC